MGEDEDENAKHSLEGGSKVEDSILIFPIFLIFFILLVFPLILLLFTPINIHQHHNHQNPTIKTQNSTPPKPLTNPK